MRIFILADNHAQINFDAEWGLSLYIEYENKKIIFDFGNSDLFIKNANKLGIDISDIDYYILSHGHWDHGNGLKFAPRGTVICHPEVFTKRYNGNRYIGLDYSYEQAIKKNDFIFSIKPYEINENIIFLGEIPRITEFEAKKTSFTKSDGSLDFVKDDSGLVFKTNKGLVIISGCAHSGICNTIEYAKKVTGISKVYAVYGGFHLKGKDTLSFKTIAYLKNMDIEHIKASHCTEFSSLVELSNAFGSIPYEAGQIINVLK